MKDVTLPRSPKWAHKHNPIIKNRICSSEIVTRKALKSVDLRIKQEIFVMDFVLKTSPFFLKYFSLEEFKSK